MITVNKTTAEGRGRDKRRRRLILSVGSMKYHVSREEAEGLLRSLKRALGRL